MAKATIRAKFIWYLEETRWIRSAEQRGRKYLRYYKIDSPGYLYVGKSGSLRYGKSVAKSRPVSDKQKRLMVEAYDKAHPPKPPKQPSLPMEELFA